MSRFRFRWVAHAALGAAALAVTGALALAQNLRIPDAPTRIEIEATPMTSFEIRDASRRRFGALEFRGGLEMRSKHRAFGGLSGIAMQQDGGGFLAVTDNGSWLKARILYRDGAPTGIADAEMAPLLDADGKPLAARGWFDAESLAQAGDQVYVGFERVHAIAKFSFGGQGVLARGQPVTVPPDFATLNFNKSLECIAAVPERTPNGGTLIVVSEDSRDGAGNIRAFILDGDKTARFSVRKSDDYDITDCAVAPPASLLLLERKFARATGVAIRLRKVALASIRAGATVDGPVLLEADMGHQIDNLEALGIHRDAQGDTILTLVSDDNFSAIQRTILLQFALLAP